MSSEAKIVVLHLITGLSTGGAETMLYKLLSKTNHSRFKPIVISLIDKGTLGDRIEALGIPVYTIGMEQGKPTLATIWQLIHLVGKLKPDLIQCWMYHSILAGEIASIFRLKSIPVIWNIRHSLYSLSYEKRLTADIIKILSFLSIFSKKIIYNSQISARQHEKLGYKSRKTIIIPNGFDPDFFKPSIEVYKQIREELNLRSDCFLIGRFARYHEMKDYPNLLQAAAILLRDYPDVHFLLAGDEVNPKNEELCQIIQKLGISDRIHLLGERKDIPRLTAALDIASTTSFYGEAFPNVIGEAMSCGIPCVVTDVGDSAWIVGNTGRVVSPQNPQALANAWKELIALGAENRKVLGKAARDRIIASFSLDYVVAQYEGLYESVTGAKAAAPQAHPFRGGLAARLNYVIAKKQ
ncbi:glycosyltransferase family 4 protein [Argonema galeatum]|uniref:glycosyltransferase family 4 protein n=1 Tax=Argonema galeatum TaxID=2942762 RepID=UPI002010EEEF|nr:glycosyltransferase [Argonema galeatum]MCL1467424.1 glycosyltransferase [Argonema galeatum A003/A1]